MLRGKTLFYLLFKFNTQIQDNQLIINLPFNWCKSKFSFYNINGSKVYSGKINNMTFDLGNL